MPAHQKKCSVGARRLSNGEFLTEIDRQGNELADRHAKLAVRAHRVPKAVRERMQRYDLLVTDTAAWIGMITHHANNREGIQARDSVAARSSARHNKPQRARRPKDDPSLARPTELGGHQLEPDPINGGGHCLQCSCKVGPAWYARFCRQTCTGIIANRWNKRARGELDPVRIHHSLPGLIDDAAAPAPDVDPPPPLVPSSPGCLPGDTESRSPERYSGATYVLGTRLARNRLYPEYAPARQAR